MSNEFGMPARDAIKAMKAIGDACKRAAPALQGMSQDYAAWQADCAAAEWMGEVPPSLEVWLAERQRS